MRRFIATLAKAIEFMTLGIGEVHGSCNVDIEAISLSQPGDVPESSARYLASRLQQLVTTDNTASMSGSGRFFITGRFDHVFYDKLPGPPEQTVLHTNLTLYIGDAVARKIFASATIELRGVGTSLQRAFINALRIVNPENSVVKDFISRGTEKVVAYYDQNYPHIISEAQQAASKHNYDEAIWKLTLIPSCSKGYQQASSMIVPMVKKHIDHEGENMLALASAVWAKSPDSIGAHEAIAYIKQIDPSSEAYAKAERLGNEIKKTVRDDIDFETRQKYTDQVKTDQLLINAAREIGVAYGQGQKQSTTNLTWIR